MKKYLILFLLATQAFAGSTVVIPTNARSWKTSVATVGALPASGNTAGDARVVLSSSVIYVWDGAAWQSSGGGGGGSGTVTSVLGTAPIVSDGSTTTPTISCIVASGSVAGCLASADFTTFNAKQNAFTFTAPIASTGGGSPVLSCTSATASVKGCLDAADFTTFNNKESALTFSTGLTRTSNTITANLATGVSGGQSAIGGTASGNSLTLSSTTNGTKGKVIFGSLSAYDEVNDYWGLGTTTPISRLETVETGTAAVRGILSGQYNDGTNSSRFIGRKARGTRASPTTVVTADVMTTFLAEGYDSANYIQSGMAQFTTTGTIAATRVPSVYTLSTSTDATPSVLTEAFRVSATQNMAVGTTTTTNARLASSGSTTDSTANSFFAGDSVNTSLLTVRNDGMLTYGKDLAIAASFLGSSYTPTITASSGTISTEISGISIKPTYAGTSQITDVAAIRGIDTNTNTNASSVHRGGYFQSFNSGAAARAATVSGVYTLAKSSATGGTVTSMSALDLDLDKSGAGAVTSMYGARVMNLSNTGGTTGTMYAYHVGDITTGTQTNGAFSFYNSDANANQYFLGKTLIGGAVTATNANLIALDGHQKSTQTTAPVATVNANAGTGGTCSLSNATDSAGTINLTTTATAPGAGAQCSIAFNLAYNVAPICVVGNASTNAALFSVINGVYFTTTTTTLVVNFTNADATGHANNWMYRCMETQ